MIDCFNAAKLSGRGEAAIKHKVKCQEAEAASLYRNEQSLVYKAWQPVSDSLIISSLV